MGGPAVSAREAEVLAALGERLTNAEIAQRLFISVRTVETHVSALLRKLAVDNRRALAGVARDLAAAETAPTSPRPPPLPARLTTFLGRDDEVTAVITRLRGDRLVTITGPAGVGKTRLAVEVAARSGARYDDGVWFVDLTPATDAMSVLSAVVDVFSVRDEPGRSPRDGLLAGLRSASALLVVDNCEHVLDAASDLLLTVLASASGVHVLATSREALAVPGESVLALQPLAAPADHHGETEPATVAGNDAVRLFVDRARAVDLHFALDAATAPAVASICRHLDGVPLALELAAAQVHALSVQQIDARLGDRFALLRAPGRGRASRHHALDTALAWSYDLLAPAERALLDRLAVFRGGCTVEAAEHVASGPPVDAGAVMDLLIGLVRKSLVVAEAVGTERRYRLLESVREYGWHRLATATEIETWRARHQAWVLSVTQLAAEGLAGSEQARWLDLLDQELDNIEWAFGWSMVDPERAAQALGAVHGLQNYWLARGIRRRQGITWSQAAAASATGVDVATRVRLLLDAVLLVVWSDLTSAEALADMARQLAGDDATAGGYADLAAALVRLFRGEAVAGELAAKAVEALASTEPLHLWARGAVGLARHRSGDYAGGRRLLREVAEDFGAAGDEHLAGAFQSFAADLAAAAGDLGGARAHAALGLRAARQFTCPSCESSALLSLAVAGPDTAEGGPLTVARAAVRLAHGISETWGTLCALEVTTGALADQGMLVEAAILGAATTALYATTGFVAVLPARAARLTAGIAAARTGLTAHEFDDVWRDGAALGYDAAVSFALG